MIAGSTPTEAAGRLRALMQQALACVTPAVLSERPTPPARTYVLVRRLPTAQGGLTLKIQHTFLLVHDQARPVRARWEARTASYAYQLDAADGREMLAYHWHPSGLIHERRPHLHIGAGYGEIRPVWQKAHLLTGPLSPAVLLELCLTHLAVAPRRPDWAAVLARLATALAQREPPA